MHLTSHEGCQSKDFNFFHPIFCNFSDNFKCQQNLGVMVDYTSISHIFKFHKRLDLMFILAVVDIYKIFFQRLSFFGVLVLKFCVVL